MRSPRYFLPLLAAALVASAAFARPKETQRQVMHPRAPQTPLEYDIKPYYCPLCVKEERIEPKEVEVRMMRIPVADLAKEIGLDEDEYIVIQTAHFKILSTLPKSKVKMKDSPFVRADLERLKTIFPKLTIGREGARVNPHQRAHLYHIRAERTFAHFAALVDEKSPYLGMEGPYELYLWDEYTQQHAFVDRYVGRSNDKAGVQDHRKEKPNFMLFTTAEGSVAVNDGKGDGIFSNHVIHNIAHNLADGFGNYYRETWAWLEEGIAHYYERNENPKWNSFCWTEGKKPSDFLKPDWEATIHNLVRRGRDTNFSQWCEKLIPGELTGPEQGMSWSIVEWMIKTEPIRFAKMWRKLDDYKAKWNATQCIEDAFGVSPSVLHSRWREWVLENYKKR